MRCLFIALILTLLNLREVKAQQGRLYSLGVNAMPGFLVAHREDSKNLEAHVMGYELQWSRRNIVERPWGREYDHAEIGLNLLYMDLGNPDLTGKVFCIGPNFETRVLGNERNALQFRAGSGVAYLTQKFDVYTNRRNQAIGSNLNALMQLRLNWLHSFGNSGLESNIGIGITHFSNGSFRVPNLGVNMPTLWLGVNRRYHSKHIRADASDTIRVPDWTVYAAYAFKERSLANTTTFKIINLGVERIFYNKLTRQWRVGADLFFDKTHAFGKDPERELKGLKPQEMTELAVFGGHQWLIYKVHFFFDLGVYLYKPSTEKLFVYERLGFKYQIMDHWYFRSTLKAHLGIADFLDWGIGYKL